MWEYASTRIVLGGAFGVAAALGAVMAATHYCTLGAISDWVNMGDTRRLRAWLVAGATAMLGVAGLALAGILEVGDSRILYASANFVWPRYILGGLLFGMGMSLASGCGSKLLVRAGGGSGKAVLVLAVAGFAAYALIVAGGYVRFIQPLLLPIAVDLGRFGLPDQRLGTLLGAVTPRPPALINEWSALALGMTVFGCCFAHAQFRASTGRWLAGFAVGVAVLAGWYLTAGPWGRTWLEDMQFLHAVPTGVGVQSYSFISPLADTAYFFRQGLDADMITYGMAGAFGLLCGSLVYHLAAGRFRWEWFPTWRDLARNAAGGLLLGIGGVMALGCTVGQGVTGISTLAVGSLLATGATALGAALAIKVEYYKLVYEGEASLWAALLSALADLRLLPQRWRRLAAV